MKGRLAVLEETQKATEKQIQELKTNVETEQSARIDTVGGIS